MKIHRYTKNQINLLPKNPGIYKFYGIKENLIYVGKAKNIKKRVNSYFTDKKEPSIKTRKMVKKVEYIEYTIVNSEYEALLLENNLIKNNKPKYNILLRDDKTFPFICILDERFPRIITTRKVEDKMGEYYGPFSNLQAMYKILDLIKDTFTIRTCNLNLSKKNIEKKKFKICLEYHIKNCKGPCENFQTENDYNDDINQIKNILKGNFNEVKKRLKNQMLESAKNQKFETAQEYKEKIEAIDQYYSKSLVTNPINAIDIDIFAITTDNTNANFEKAYISYIKIKKGLITFTKNIEIQRKLEETIKEILILGIVYLREQHASNAKLIITNINIEKEILNAEVLVPKIGDKRKLLELAIKNVLLAKKDNLEKDQKNKDKSNVVLYNLQKDLNLKKLPINIECFDNSNLQGTTPVSAMVSFINGKPSKKNYRHFNIKEVSGPNDFASMEEVVRRRYKKILLENRIEGLPNLIVIDGGKGQLSSAIKALKNLDIFNKIEIISIAKRLEEIYKPNDSYPIHLNKSSSSLKILQYIRDEAHRFAINFHKHKRDKQNIKSELHNIKGIGPKTVQLLLKHYKSINGIKETKKENIIELVGISKAKLIESFLKKN
ncbi:MAG: excinuclease ABC subunit C [Bacteroidetes bacterium]|nr:excinuclease ABC subunit C [Bacteroidota bacterium]